MCVLVRKRGQLACLHGLCVRVCVRSPAVVYRARAYAGFHDGLFVGPRIPRALVRVLLCVCVRIFVVILRAGPCALLTPPLPSFWDAWCAADLARVCSSARAQSMAADPVAFTITSDQGAAVEVRVLVRWLGHTYRGLRSWALVGAPIESMLTAAGDAWGVRARGRRRGRVRVRRARGAGQSGERVFDGRKRGGGVRVAQWRRIGKWRMGAWQHP